MILLLIIFLLLVIHYAVCAIYISKGLKKTESVSLNELPEEFVSVIIPFRNESENILDSLESIKKQNYPQDRFEVIYVNDKSDDDSLAIIENALNENNIKVITVPEDYFSDESKIRAVKFGIDNSKGKIIVITDCDCTHTTNWLKSILKCFDYQTGFVAGPVGFIEDNSILNEMQKLEFAGLVLTGAGLIGMNKPIICNSANLAFRKDLYDLLGGFKIEKGFSFSADEFLMIDIHNKTDYKIKFCWENDAVTYTNANKSFKDFFYQRKRWASKNWRRYGTEFLLQLLIVYLFFAGLFVQIILGILLSSVFYYSFLTSLIFKIYSEYKILKYGQGLFYDKVSLKIFFLAEILHIPYILIAGLSGLFGGIKWKNRKYNI